MGMKRARRAPKIDFQVSAEHIATATPKDSGHCMIADALAEAMPAAEYISVDLATIRFTDPAAGWRYIYLTPAQAQVALIAFDAGEPVEPFAVRAFAAQMVLTGSAKRARKAQLGIEDGRDAPMAAELVMPQGDEAAPLKIGGNRPGLTALPGGAGAHTSPAIRTGRRREYGLRALIR